MSQLNKPLFIKWQEINNTGIDIIDEQHRGIVSIINTMYHMINTNIDNNKLTLFIINAIKKYSMIHFMTEEYLLAESSYDYFEQHKELHDKFAAELERLEYSVISVDEAKPLIDLLKKWWLEHINKEDQRYVSHLLARDEAH